MVQAAVWSRASLLPLLVMLAQCTLLASGKQDPKGKLVWTVPGEQQQQSGRLTGSGKDLGSGRGRGGSTHVSAGLGKKKEEVEWETGNWPLVEGLDCRDLFFNAEGQRRNGPDYRAHAKAVEWEIGEEFSANNIRLFTRFGQHTGTITLEDDDILGEGVSALTVCRV